MQLSGKEYSLPEPNLMPKLVYLYLSRSAFLVSFTDLNKQLLNVKSVFNYYDCEPSVLEIYRFFTLLGIETYFIKQCLLKFMSGNK